MSESEIKNKRLNVLLMFIEELLNKLGKKSQEDLSKERFFKKEGKGLKIMTPNQLLARLPILL